MHVNTWSVGHKEDRARLRSVLSSDRNRGHKLKYRRYGLSTRKRISLWWWAVKVAQKGFGVSHLRLNSYVTCTQSWTACSRGPYLSRVVGPDEFQRSLTPVPCLWYCDLCFRVVFFFFFPGCFTLSEYPTIPEDRLSQIRWRILSGLSDIALSPASAPRCSPVTEKAQHDQSHPALCHFGALQFKYK